MAFTISEILIFVGVVTLLVLSYLNMRSRKDQVSTEPQMSCAVAQERLNKGLSVQASHQSEISILKESNIRQGERMQTIETQLENMNKNIEKIARHLESQTLLTNTLTVKMALIGTAAGLIGSGLVSIGIKLFTQ